MKVNAQMFVSTSPLSFRQGWRYFWNAMNGTFTGCIGFLVGMSVLDLVTEVVYAALKAAWRLL